jgi:hypothetical protein
MALAEGAAGKLIESVIVVAMAFYMIPVLQAAITEANLTGALGAIANLVLIVFVFGIVYFVVKAILKG